MNILLYPSLFVNFCVLLTIFTSILIIETLLCLVDVTESHSHYWANILEYLHRYIHYQQKIMVNMYRLELIIWYSHTSLLLSEYTYQCTEIQTYLFTLRIFGCNWHFLVKGGLRFMRLTLTGSTIITPA